MVKAGLKKAQASTIEPKKTRSNSPAYRMYLSRVPPVGDMVIFPRTALQVPGGELKRGGGIVIFVKCFPSGDIYRTE